MDERTNQAAPENNETGTPTPPEKTVKTKKRTIAELDAIVPGKMTEAEKVDYIKSLRERLSVSEQQSHAYAENCQKAYEQARTIQQQFTDYKTQAQAKLSWAKQCVDHCRTAIILAGNIE